MGDLEEQIASVFQKLLKYSPVGRTDDFFLMGGDSLSLMELKIQLVDIFGGNVPDLFEDATVAGLADSIRRMAAKPSNDKRIAPVLLPLKEKGAAPILFLVHGRLGQALVSPRFLELLGDDQPLYVFQARGVDGIQRPNKTIQAMAKDYVTAMRSVQGKGPYFLGSLCVGAYVAMEMARLLRGSGEHVGPLLLIDPFVPPFSVQEAVKSVKTLGTRLKRRLREGKIEFDLNDPNRRRGARRVAVNFEKALLNYRPTPYDGPVFLLASRERLSERGWGNQEKLKAHCSGDVHRFEVGSSHNQILDTQNEDFARHLTHCVKSARAAIATTRP